MKIYGVDFTSAPRRAKPITVAHGFFRNSVLHMEKIEAIEDFDAFEGLLRRPGPWVGGFDFPFGLPRELVRDLGWQRRRRNFGLPPRVDPVEGWIVTAR